MRLNALWWWIDRWRKSTAYTDMTLEEQGAYRNLLDEAHLRRGCLPSDERILAKACGDALAWPRVRETVLARFTRHPEGWRNETLDTVLNESVRRATKQARFRERLRQTGNANGNGHGNGVGNAGGSPSPSPSPSLISGTVSGTKTKEPPSADADAFGGFWNDYPRKVGKGAARKVWLTLRPSQLVVNQIAEALRWQKTQPQWVKDNGQFIPHPATWLRQERWTDAPVRTVGAKL